MRKITGFLYLFSILALGAHAQGVTVQDILPFVQGGAMTYNINVSLGEIDWGEDQADISKNITNLEKAFATTPSAQGAFAIFDAWDKQANPPDRKAAAAAIQDKFNKQSKNHDELLAYCEAGLRSEDPTRVEGAWKVFFPLLESGASSRAYSTAIRYKTNKMDLDMALKIAQVFRQVHPEDPAAWFAHGESLFAANLMKVLGQIFAYAQSTAPQNQEKDKGTLLKIFLTLTKDNLDFPGLDKAVSLAPGNYRFLVGSAMFKSLAAYYSKLLVASQDSQFDPKNFRDLLTGKDEGLFGPLGSYIERAKQVRPPKDVQVFLAAALYHSAFGRFAEAEKEVLEALKIRPDLKAPYNALIFTRILPLVELGNFDLLPMGEVAEKVLVEKEKRGLLDVADLGTRFSIRILRYRTPSEGKKPDPEDLKQALKDAQEGLKKDKTHPLSLLMGAWSLALTSQFSEGEKAFAKGIGLVSTNEDKGSMHLGRGVCLWALGKIKEARSEGEEALKIDPSLSRAQLLLDTLKNK